MTTPTEKPGREPNEVLARVTRLVRASPDPDRTLTAVAEAARQLLDTPAVFFWLADEASRRIDLRLVVPASLGSAMPLTSVSYDEGVLGWVARHRRRLLVPDLVADERMMFPDWWVSHKFASLIAVPVMHDDALIGVVSMVTREAFRESDTEVAEVLATQAAPALQSAVAARMEARRQATQALAEVSRLLSQTRDFDTVGQRATESVCRLLDASSAILYRASADGTLVGEAVFADDFPWVKRLPAGAGLAGFALRERTPVFTADLLTDSRLTYTRETREALGKSTHRAMLAVPLVAQERELGVLTVGDHTGRRFGDDDIRLVQAFADQTAVALESARLYREASRQAARMSALAAVERLLSETLDAPVVTRRIVETIGDLVDAQAARLFRVDGDEYVLAAAAGDAGPRMDGLRLTPGTGLLALAVQERKPVQSPNILEDERVVYTPEQRQVIERAQFRAILAAPLVVNQRVIGVLNVGGAAGRVWDADDVNLVQTFADQAARALENARLFADEQAARAAAQAAAQALRESEAVRQRAMQLGQIGSWTSVAPDGTLAWSDEVCRIFGVERAALTGTIEDFFARVHPDDLAKLDAARKDALASGGQFSVEHRIIRPDGALRWVHELADIERDGAARPLRFIGVVQDITERKQAEEALQVAEEQLRHSQKMDAIGRLAGGVAHDFNNLLSIVIGRTELMLQRAELSSLMRRDVDLIHRTAERAATLTRQLLAFSRKQVLQPKVIDLNAVVSSMGRMLRRVIGEDVDLVIVARPGHARVNADPGQIEQVIMNLVVNARDAMPNGGRLMVETAEAEVDAAHATRHPGVPPGHYVVLTVADTGIGMDAVTRERIFEPFFTTKEVGKGTGLGLSTVYGIVQQSGGAIAVFSEPGRGATFKIYLPSVTDPVEETVAKAAGPRGGSETVLLCEDEADLRELAREVLADLGYTVLEAGDGTEALDISERHAGPIHLLVTDVVMPRMNGSELALRLARERPLRVLYMSGYTETPLVPDQQVPGSRFMQKPFSPMTLAQAVREVLDGVA